MSPQRSKIEWHKSSYSTANGSCVEVAETPHTVLVRDTQNRGTATLAFPGNAWSAFLHTVKADRV